MGRGPLLGGRVGWNWVMPRCLVAADMSPVGEELTTIGSTDCLCSNPYNTENMMQRTGDKRTMSFGSFHNLKQKGFCLYFYFWNWGIWIWIPVVAVESSFPSFVARNWNIYGDKTHRCWSIVYLQKLFPNSSKEKKTKHLNGPLIICQGSVKLLWKC